MRYVTIQLFTSCRISTKSIVSGVRGTLKVFVYVFKFRTFIYRSIISLTETDAPTYLIPVIASLVVLAAILLLILCIRGKWRDKKRRDDGLTPLTKKRNRPLEKVTSNGRKYYNQTSSDSSSSAHSSSTQSTELRNFDYNRASLLESASTCSSPPVLSPPLSPREEGAKDEWRRFQVRRNSTQIEIIV